MTRSLIRVACTAALAIGLVSVARNASAASSTCWAAWSDRFCSTECIPANSSNHFVHINISPWSDAYHVRDCNNGVIVYSGSSGFWGVSKTITGLYARYKIYLYGALWPSGHATINNN